jgi:uncharacterized protein (DUF433 family)
MQDTNRITLDPQICHGKPCIRGLRYPVANVLEWLAGGMSIEEILADYEDLEREDVLAVLAYAARIAQVKSISRLAAHNPSLDRALAIIEAAAEAGAHGLKIQTYTADTMTLDLAEGEFFISDPNSLWAGTSLYQLYQEAHTPWELYHDPELLILDEATSALDNLTEQAVMEAVRCLRHRKTIILIAHRLTTVRECDQIFLLENGRLEGQGTFDELTRQNRRFRAMAGAVS